MRALLLVFFLATACCSPPALLPPMPEVLLVETMFSAGSGVPIAQEGSRLYVLTSAHNANPTSVGGMAVLERHEHPLLDAAVLVIDSDPVRTVRLAAADPKPGDLLVALGFHLGEHLTPSLGLAGELGTMSCHVLFGASGGAVVNRAGELVGIIDHLTMLQGPDGVTHPMTMLTGYVPISALQPWLGGILP